MATVDRISHLPRNILDLILEGLPTHDAARTTSLSKTWRNVWVRHPYLIFDYEFIARLVSKIKEEDQQYAIVTTVSNILLRHRGPILKFHLFIPGLLFDQTSSMDSWIQKIVNKRIRMLEIVSNLELGYLLPSCLFFCAELTHLQLSNCVLHAPNGFRGFRNLISVKLSSVLIIADMSFGSQLQTLDLRLCTGIKHLRCQFTCSSNLSKLIIDSEDINWQWSEVGNGSRVIRKAAANAWKKYSINLDKMLRNIPRIHLLCLDGYFLKFLESDGGLLNRPITTMDDLHILHLVHVGFHDLVQIHNILCLVKSSPNLHHLTIILENLDYFPLPQEPEILVEGSELSIASRVEQYLKLPNLVDMIFDKLESVDIHGMVGSRCEFYLIKFLLASSTSLKWMRLWKSVTIDDPEEELKIELKIIRELKRFRMASPTAQIVWT